MSGIVSDNQGRASGLIKAASTAGATYDAEYLLVAGGGAGGQSYSDGWAGGGGGAGGYASNFGGTAISLTSASIFKAAST